MKNKRSLILSHSIFTADPQQEKVDGYLLMEGQRLLDVKPGTPSEEVLKSVDEMLDFRNKTVCPGLIDPHTHLIFGGSRENELALKLAGASYMEIHKEGGIKSTVRKTREASLDELRRKALKSLESMLLHGTTTVEAKSGYGLDKETELRSLRLIRELQQLQALDLIPTYLGAHDVSPEFDSAEQYADFIIEEMLPLVKKEDLAQFVDIFCEKGIFELETSRRIAEAAKAEGFKLKIHADEIAPLGGAGLAADLHATSAEHLMSISDQDIHKMADSGTVAVLLPATSYFLMVKDFAPARKMLEAGVHVALASDFNPGSSPCENLQMAMFMACYEMKLTPEEILRAVTREAAIAISREDEIGQLKKGFLADITVFDAPSPAYLLYHFGINSVCDVFKSGEHVVRNGCISTAAVASLLASRRGAEQ